MPFQPTTRQKKILKKSKTKSQKIQKKSKKIQKNPNTHPKRHDIIKNLNKSRTFQPIRISKLLRVSLSVACNTWFLYVIQKTSDGGPEGWNIDVHHIVGMSVLLHLRDEETAAMSGPFSCFLFF
jgi:hypothetical protein